MRENIVASILAFLLPSQRICVRYWQIPLQILFVELTFGRSASLEVHNCGDLNLRLSINISLLRRNATRVCNIAHLVSLDKTFMNIDVQIGEQMRFTAGAKVGTGRFGRSLFTIGIDYWINSLILLLNI